MKQLFTVFENEGEDYVADERMVLTSNPTMYTCYRLSDGKQIYQFCHTVRGNHKRYATDEETKKRLPSYSYFNASGDT